LAVALCCAAIAGRGGDEGLERDDAVEAQERNELRLGGLVYRFATFRQLNPRPLSRILLDDVDL
jgi:hypothetical protein